MRLYIFPFAPNVLRVQIVAHEKGVAVDTVDVSGDREGYRSINPLGQVPALELDDGRVITESLTICQHLDAISGAPFLFGGDDRERLQIAMWERRAEMGLFNPSVEYGHHVHPMFAGLTKQSPDYAATLVPRARMVLDTFADQLVRTHYVAGERFTAADVTAFLGYFGLAAYGGVEMSERRSLRRWSGEMMARESMAALRQMAAAFGMPTFA